MLDFSIADPYYAASVLPIIYRTHYLTYQSSLMQLRDLELFCEVAAQGSISKAAKMHDVSQPVVSETVKNLEEYFGMELFNRAKRPLEPTGPGEVLLEGSKQLLANFRRLEDRMLQLRNKVVGPVRVAAIYSVGLLQMDAYVKQFERLYPDAVLEVRYLHPDAVIQKSIDGEVDLGLLSFPPKNPDLVCEEWHSQEMVVVVAPTHRLASRTSLQVKELDGEATVSYTPELRIRSELDKWLRRADVKVEVVHEFDNIENIKRAVEIGSGIAILPAPTVRREIEIGSLKSLRLEDVQWSRPLGVIYRRGQPLTAAVSRFLDLLLQTPEAFGPSGSAEAGSKRTRASNDAPPSTLPVPAGG